MNRTDAVVELIAYALVIALDVFLAWKFYAACDRADWPFIVLWGVFYATTSLHQSLAQLKDRK